MYKSSAINMSAKSPMKSRLLNNTVRRMSRVLHAHHEVLRGHDKVIFVSNRKAHKPEGSLFLLSFEICPVVYCKKRSLQYIHTASLLIMQGYHDGIHFSSLALLRASGLFTCEFLLQPCSK